MLEKELDQINEADLQALIDNEILENKTTAYKSRLPGESTDEKADFLASVSSLANTNGGDLIIGMVRDPATMLPKTLVGIELVNPGAEIARLHNLIRSGLRPRIPDVSTRILTLKEGSRTVIIIRIKQSWASPHRVILVGHDKFYARNSSGKYPLDVAELRAAFNLSETITERMRSFRAEHLSSILAGDTPVPYDCRAGTILHILPLSAFASRQDLAIADVPALTSKMPPIGSSGGHSRYNLDGFLTYQGDSPDQNYAYVQLYRNGIIEAVDGSLVQNNRISSQRYELDIIKSVADYLALLRTLGVGTPVFLFMVLYGVKDSRLAVSREHFNFQDDAPIDRDILPLPEVEINDLSAPAETILKPCFDSIWNAGGFKRCFDYNEAGDWDPDWEKRP